MILVIRGHIRDSFKTKNLLKLTKRIINDNREIKIYIHTWNVFSTKVSWRNYVDGHEMVADDNIVTEETVMNYFNDISRKGDDMGLDIEYFAEPAVAPGTKDPIVKPKTPPKRGPWTKPKTRPNPKAVKEGAKAERKSYRRKGFYK